MQIIIMNTLVPDITIWCRINGGGGFNGGVRISVNYCMYNKWEGVVTF